MDLKQHELNIHALYKSRALKFSKDVSYLFDVNYLKIMRLMPHLHTINSYDVAHATKQNTVRPLHLWKHENAPYTTIITLSHLFHLKEKMVKRPDIKIKICFDSDTAEALSICNQEIINVNHPYISRCQDIEIKWELNTLLEKWLDYCLAQNYEWQHKQK